MNDPNADLDRCAALLAQVRASLDALARELEEEARALKRPATG
jgi:hypothetical protein